MNYSEKLGGICVNCWCSYNECECECLEEETFDKLVKEKEKVLFDNTIEREIKISILDWLNYKINKILWNK